MTTILGVTGTRKLTAEQAEQVRYDLWELDRKGTLWHVGDAAGVDAMARTTIAKGQVIEHKAKGRDRWQLATRSTELVKALAESGGTLHAWANQEAPAGLKPSKSWKSASGSGTWGTIALAVGLGVAVVLHWLGEERKAPDWLR